MTKTKLFSELSKAAACVAILGAIAVAAGFIMQYATVVNSGYLVLAIAAYIWAFTVAKSF